MNIDKNIDINGKSMWLKNRIRGSNNGKLNEINNVNYPLLYALEEKQKVFLHNR